MNIEIGAEAALFPEKEYKSEILLAVDHLIGTIEYYWLMDPDPDSALSVSDFKTTTKLFL